MHAPRRPRSPRLEAPSPLATLSALAVAANEGKTLAGAMPKLLRLLCEAGGWDLGHAYRLATVGTALLPLSEWWPPLWPPSNPFRQATSDLPIETRGLVSEIVAADGPVWVEDIAEAEWLLRRRAALDSGLRSLLAFPVTGPTGMIGLIELIGREPRPPDPAQLELARHAGIVLGQVLERESAERHFRALFDRLPTPIALATLAEGCLVEANEALARLLGRSRPTMLGHTLDELGIAIPERLRRERSHDGPPTTGWTIEFSATVRDGTPRRLMAALTALPWDGSQHLLATFTDVTRLRSVEDEADRSRARVRALARRLLEVQEEERSRLSRELHDHAGQRLTAVRIILGRLGHEGPDPELLTQGTSITEELMEQVRTLSFELRPAMLDQLGLATASKAYVERHARASGLQWSFTAEPSTPILDEAAQTALFRILQEAVTNVLRHADAHTIDVRLGVEGDELVLAIEDDGGGFDTHSETEILGLAIMQERAREVGARLAVSSALGKGTRVEVRRSMDADRGPEGARP